MTDEINKENSQVQQGASEQPKCADLINDRWDSRMTDFVKFNEGEYEEEYNEEGYKPEEDGEPNEYGLCLDYVKPHTWCDCDEEYPEEDCDEIYGYWRYQLSYGGPSDEIRFHDGGRIEYRYHDWWDGAGINLCGAHKTFMENYAENFLCLEYYDDIRRYSDGSHLNRSDAAQDFKNALFNEMFGFGGR